MITSFWTDDAIRVTNITRNSIATRDITCFEVLDYDSHPYVIVNKFPVSVHCIIYKKVTIKHNQERKFMLSYSHPQANTKDIRVPIMPLWYLDSVPATDNYDYAGSRVVEYKLCLLVGTQKYTLDLETLTINIEGYHNLSGTDKELKEDGPDPLFPNTYVDDSVGPLFTLTGNRLYGVSVNCGKDAITYTYDVESLDPSTSFSNNALFQFDSPVNLEDYNGNWIKEYRIVGAMNYYGIRDSKQFSCDEFPDTVLAVGYGIF